MDDVVADAIAGNQNAFTTLVERHRHELQVHCYRMLGSFEDAEDQVQETFLRAWRKRDTYQARATFRAWLYRIATNACLDFLDRHPRTPKPYADPPAIGEPDTPRPQYLPWLQPFPDHLLDRAAEEAGPDTAVVRRETIELAFLTAIHHLPPRQRAVLVLRDVLGWRAEETAELLDITVPAVKSALQRARPVLREHLPASRTQWAPTADPDKAERDLLRRYMSVLDDQSPATLTDLFRHDVVITMPPHTLWFAGRDPFLAGMAELMEPTSPNYIGEWRSMPTRANRQPAVAHYVRPPGETVFHAQVLDVIHMQNGEIASVMAFVPDLFPAFGLPTTL